MSSPNRKNAVISIKINPARITSVLLIIVAFLVFASSSGYFLKFVIRYPGIKNFSLFNLDCEGNVPTYFSSLILLFSSFLFGLIGFYKKRENDSYVFHWGFLCLIFVYLSLDEAIAIHELLNRPLRTMFALGGIFYYASVIPGIIAILILLVGYYKFWVNLPSRSKFFFTVAFICYAGGTVGMELVGGRHSDLYGIDNLSYGVLTTLEETLEMVGIVLLIYALMDYIRTYLKQVQFQLD